MIRFSKSFYKEYPELVALVDIIKKKHKVAPHTEKVLLDNAHVKNFCEESRHFVIIGGDLHVHYDVTTWYENESFLVCVDAVAFYDDLMEYEVERLKGVHSTNCSTGGNLN